MKPLLPFVLLALCSACAPTKLPPLPVPLTAEEDARLVATGELPKEVAAPVAERLIAYNYDSTPLSVLTDLVTELTGVHFEDASNSTATITMKSSGRITVPEFLAAFSNELKRLDITLEPVTTGVVRVHDAHAWTTPAAASSMSYAERRQQRLAGAGVSTNQPPRPRYTGEALNKRLEDFGLRPGIQSRPPPLTPEQDAELVRQGILPPVNDCATNAPQKVPGIGKP